MGGVINSLFNRTGQNASAYNTPTKGNRLTDILYGSNPSNDRNGLHS